MKLKIFSVRDSKVNAFMRPFFAQTTAEGIRIWDDSVNADNTGFKRHPEDYCLFELGEFDPLTGALSSLQQPHSLGLAVQFVRYDNAQLMQPPGSPNHLDSKTV